MSRRDEESALPGRESHEQPELTGSEIAIIGMSCRFPGASTIREFWRNLRDGLECLTELSDEELAEAGVPAELIADPSFVRRASVLQDIEDFDARFFGYTPLEATIMDPQHRLFLECAWEVLEHGGYDPGRYGRPIGVFTGAKTNTYLFNVVAQRHRFPGLDNFQIALGNDLAAMATRVSYKLDLRGPSYALHTACSTSLVAVHLACQSLLLDECAMAIAGGAAVNYPQKTGYAYQKGGILSPDGSCRTFDAGAAGSNFGNGVGAVLLKRLDDALADGDHVHAVIRGSATNNDGAAKASFTAPGVEGQTAVLLEAMAVAGVEADDISYVEAHGTATDLGDSIEMLALTQAFRASSQDRGFCALGSAKTNLGHLETAAGVAGLIKTALALEHGELPPSLHYESPNPKIDFDSSPFEVNAELRPWPAPAAGKKRVAGVSSFGIGSTNAHVLVEEAPRRQPTTATRGLQVLPLSARSPTALEVMSRNLAEHLEQDPELELADVAYTLQVGRRRFAHRRVVLAASTAEAVARLHADAGRPEEGFTVEDAGEQRAVAFLLPGLGDQRLHLARDLYENEPVFRQALDEAFAALRPHAGEDLLPVLYPERSGEPTNGGAPDLRRMLGRGGGPAPDPAAARLDATRRSQPVLFAVELALARLWMARGVTPRAMLGYSLGEYVAAHLAGVLELDEAARLVARRAQLIDGLPAGAMLGVSLSEDELLPLLGDELSLAAINGPQLTVAAGPPEAVAALAEELREKDVACRPIATTHAFHSRMMEPIAAELRALVAGFDLQAPRIPYVSNVTGTWITDKEATDPAYWARHLCAPVRFADGVATLLEGPPQALLEMGSGTSLATFVKLHDACDKAQAARVATSLAAPAWTGGDASDDQAALRGAFARLWAAGVDVDWPALHGEDVRRRVPLPAYPFERERLWLDAPTEEEMGRALAGKAAGARDAMAGDAAGSPTRVTLDREEIDDWIYRPIWRPVEVPALDDEAIRGPVLVFSDGGTLAARLSRRLAGGGRVVTEVRPGLGGELAGEDLGDGVRRDGSAYLLDPHRPEAYGKLLEILKAEGRRPATAIHLWSLSAPEDLGVARALGFDSLLFFAQAHGRRATSEPLAITVVTARAQKVLQDDPLEPERSLILGPARVIPQEMPGVSCRVIDVEGEGEDLTEALLAELAVTARDATAHELVAYRGGERRQQDFERLHLDVEAPTRLREEGVYVVTGGLGGLGRTLATYLAETYRARLVLVGRSPLPEPEAWPAWLAEHGEDDPKSAKIRAVEAMRAAGGEVLVESADVADVEAMGRVRDAAVQRFGKVDGVVHAAGIPGGGILQLKTAEAATAILRPKVDGVRALAEVFLEDGLDFLFIYSSVASILGEFGQADYCAANAYLDAFAVARDGRVPPVLTVNWDVWGDVGLAVDTEVPEHLRAWREEMLAKGLRSSEGLEVFERLLAAGLEGPGRPQLVVSTQDLQGRIELGKSFTGERFLAELGLAPEASASAPAGPAQGGAASPVSGLGRQAVERRLTEIWEKILGVEVKVDDNFFDLGGNSLVGLQLVGEVNREFGCQVTPVELFEKPTVRGLRLLLEPEEEAAPATTPRQRRRTASQDVAIVGMAGRFPGAADVDELWRNLRDGVESVRFFSDEELLAAGVAPELLENPLYVRAGSVVDGIDLFDARLFGYSPREAEVMDPQQRLFLECAWEALETAACDPRRYPGRIGVFAGSNLSTYLLKLHADPEVAASLNMLQAILGNDKDALTTRVSYKLDLKGPSIAVQTFCSTSLVAVHMAARSLLDGDCDAALAGGIRIVVPSEQGYLYEERGIAPRDGHTRSFDAGATGAVLGNGVGVVVLKRLEDALADGDPIRAVIKGSAINNDGAGKAGYTAPSVEGQSQVVRDALDAAGVDPSTVSYVEAHGSATELGDPIEITALTRAYGGRNGAGSKCAIGSVKSNFGHLDRAAGVAGLIKTVMSLERRELVPSINYETPNPQIDFESGPFRVQVEHSPWERNGHPRRAGVNSLGMGGTNVHVIVEEAPEPPSKEGSGEASWQLLVLSAATPWSLDRATERLAGHLEARREAGALDAGELADVAYTLQTGRRELPYRRMLVCRDGDGAVAGLAGPDKARALFSGHAEDGERSRIFLFPGLGGQYVAMGRELYGEEPVFREIVDRAASLLEEHLGVDLREVLYPEGTSSTSDDPAALDLRSMLRRGNGASTETEAQQRLDRTLYTQPALFVVEYALARLWLERGVQPDAMLGYSIGEYVAACLAGVMSFEDALGLVAFRARLIEDLPGGGMLAVALAKDAVQAHLEDQPELSTAAVNTPQQTVVAGPAEALDRLAERLEADDVSCRRLQVSHAFHSHMLREATRALTERAARIELSAPRIPFVSNVTGTWMRDEDATDPAYWARHMCEAVRFSDGLETVLDGGAPVLLEVGPQALSSLALQHPSAARGERRSAVPVVSSLRHAFEGGSDGAYLLSALGKLWLAGVEIDWTRLHGDAPRRRRLLPTYAFDRQRYWIETRNDRRLTSATPHAESAESETGGVGSYDRPDLRVEYLAPRDELEESIAVVWRELLGVAQVGVHDNLLELGGDSLLATRMISRLREVVGFELPIRLFFEAPTIDQLADAIRELQAEQGPPDPVDDSGATDEDDLQELLALVGQMSEEELDAELARRQAGELVAAGEEAR